MNKTITIIIEWLLFSIALNYYLIFAKGDINFWQLTGSLLAGLGMIIFAVWLIDLFGMTLPAYSKKINYVPRYSSTEEYDKMGRWTRIAYYNGIQVAWINRKPHGNKDIFHVSLQFPTRGSDCAHEFKHFFSYEECINWIDARWVEFKKTTK
jgi:hypothetical protein